MARKPLGEKEWFAADRWQDLLVPLFPDHRYTKAVGAQRKLRLLLCAAARQGWGVMPDDRSRTSVEVAERFAERHATARQLTAARTAAEKVFAAAERARERTEAECRSEFDRRVKAAGAGEWSSRWPSDLAAPFAETLRAQFAARVAVCATADPVDIPAVEKGLLFVPDVVIPLEEFATRMPEWHEVGDDDPPDPRPDLIRDVFGYPFAPVAFKAGWRTDIVTGLTEGIATDGTFDRLPILADSLEEAGCDNAQLLDHCRGGGPHVRGCWAVELILGRW